MRLRARLAVTTVAVSVPMVFGLVFWDTLSRRRAAEAELIEFTRQLAASPAWLDRCEANPSSWRGEPPGPPSRPGGPAREPRPPPRLRPLPHSRPAMFFAYGTDFTSQHAGAPALSSEVQRSFRDQDAISVTDSWQGSVVRVVVKTPGEARACAFILAEGTTEPWLGGILPPTHVWFLPVLSVFASVLFAVGPVVQRIQKLTAAARRSAASEYEKGVAGGGDDEVTELAHALDEAARRVRHQLAETHRSELALREFLANTTHDLMLPLTVLQGHLADLQRTPGASGETLAAAMSEAHYIGALIHNLGIAARLETAEPALMPAGVDLGALVERVVSRHRSIARSLNVSIDRAAPAMIVQADITLLEQAVSNLVYNAVRYNRPGGHVAVIVEGERESGFVIRVIDDGPGIPEADLARALERGFRGDDARTRAPDGRGLGLHIALRVAELHGFQLKFMRSEYGGLQVDLSGSREPVGELRDDPSRAPSGDGENPPARNP